MKTKIQSYLILLATLIIGMVLGFLINGQIVKNRLDRTRGFLKDREGRIEHILEEVEMSQEQKEAVKPILELHFDRMYEIHQKHRKEFRGEFSLLKNKLAEHLDESQMQELSQKMRLSRKRGGRNEHQKHPHPPPARDIGPN